MTFLVVEGLQPRRAFLEEPRMTEQTMTEKTTHTLEVPGAVLTYDVRSERDGDGPVLLLIGSPMGAAGFGTLAGSSPTAPS